MAKGATALEGHERMTSASNLDAFYGGLERRLSPDLRPDLATLVGPSENSNQPFHRWFHLKEAFSARIVPALLAELEIQPRKSFTMLDPFAGGGTSLLSAMQAARSLGVPVEAHGIELNPFLYLLAGAKVKAEMRRPVSFVRYANLIAKEVSKGRVAPVPTPRLSTFANTSYVPSRNLRRLLQVRAAIDCHPASQQCQQLAMVCLGAVVEPATRLRRDGRALRFEPSKEPVDVLDQFMKVASEVDEDLQSPRSGAKGSVLHGDSREPLCVNLR